MSTEAKKSALNTCIWVAEMPRALCPDPQVIQAARTELAELERKADNSAAAHVQEALEFEIQMLNRRALGCAEGLLAHLQRVCEVLRRGDVPGFGIHLNPSEVHLLARDIEAICVKKDAVSALKGKAAK